VYEKKWHQLFPSVRKFRKQIATIEPNEQRSLLHHFNIFAETIVGTETNVNSVGVAMPEYIAAMTAVAKYTDYSKQPATSLLLGSLSSDSANEMSALLEQYLPSSSLHVVDLYISRSLRERTDQYPVIQADTLQLPYKDNTFDFIATNSLLHMLEFSEEIAISDAFINLFRETKRVLKPNGVACFVETIPPFEHPPMNITEYEYFAAILSFTALESGFLPKRFLLSPSILMQYRSDIYHIYQLLSQGKTVPFEEISKRSYPYIGSLTMILGK
jgi:SAM-dependent methyltransferase